MVIPQLIVIALLFSYIILGSAVFVLTDGTMANENFTDIILFSFTTLATIGEKFIKFTKLLKNCTV